MNSEESTEAIVRITVVVLIVLLVCSSSACALGAEGGSSYQSVLTDQAYQSQLQYQHQHQHQSLDILMEYGACSLPDLGFSTIVSVSDHTVRLFEDSRIIEAAGDLIEGLSGGSSDVVLPIGAVLLRYSRHDDSDPLDNDVRRQVYETVERSPGTYISEVSEECDASRSTIRYHVRILEEEGLIVGETNRGKHRFSPAGSDDPELAAALNDNATSRVLDAIARLEPVTVSTLADDLDRSPGTVSYHLDRLSEDGLLERERVGNTVVTRLESSIQTEIQNRETAVSPAD